MQLQSSDNNFQPKLASVDISTKQLIKPVIKYISGEIYLRGCIGTDNYKFKRNILMPEGIRRKNRFLIIPLIHKTVMDQQLMNSPPIGNIYDNYHITLFLITIRRVIRILYLGAFQSQTPIMYSIKGYQFTHNIF